MQTIWKYPLNRQTLSTTLQIPAGGSVPTNSCFVGTVFDGSYVLHVFEIKD